MTTASPSKRTFADLLPIARTTLVMLLVTWAGHLGAMLPDVSVAAVLALLPGLAAMFVVVLTGYVLAILLPSRLPDIFWISIAATVAGMPGVPGSALFIASVSALSFVAMITPVLAFVALSLTEREVTLFRQTGLKMIVISTLVFVGTFVGSALVAHAVLLATGT